jgi:hypothetical protein
MTDKLFLQFFTKLQELINLLNLAPSKLSEYGIRHHWPDKDQLDAWKVLTKRVVSTQMQLKKLTDESIKQNEEKIDQHLDTLRGLSRYMDGKANGYWSAYYPDIGKCLGEMAVLRNEIDKKYKLGKYNK